MFQATLRQHYALEEVDLLVLEETYVGDVGPGDELTIELPEAGPLGFTLWDTSGGLPAQGEPLLRARPDWAVPSQLGDTTVVRVRGGL